MEEFQLDSITLSISSRCYKLKLQNTFRFSGTNHFSIPKTPPPGRAVCFPSASQQASRKINRNVTEIRCICASFPFSCCQGHFGNAVGVRIQICHVQQDHHPSPARVRTHNTRNGNAIPQHRLHPCAALIIRASSAAFPFPISERDWKWGPELGSWSDGEQPTEIRSRTPGSVRRLLLLFPEQHENDGRGNAIG